MRSASRVTTRIASPSTKTTDKLLMLDRSVDLGRIARRLAAEVTLLQVEPVPAYDPDELGFEVEGQVEGEPFKAQLSIEPEMRLWDILDGDLPDGFEDAIIQELYQDPRYQSHDLQMRAGPKL